MHYKIRIFCRGCRKRFDKVFYHGKFEQFGWILVIVTLLMFVAWLIGRFFFGVETLRVIELFLDPGCFQDAEKNGNIFFQLVVTIVGSIFFTCFLINSCDNWLDRHVDSYQKGSIYYDFDNHILILGANDMLINLMKALLDEPENQKRDIVVVTSQDAEDLRVKLRAHFSKKVMRNIYVVYGIRTHRETLEKLDVDEANKIFILGEENEEAHDAINIKCHELLKVLCEKAEKVIDCSMELDKFSSLYHFYFNEHNESTAKLRLNIINTPESIAQRVLVSREYLDGVVYPALDRDGIGSTSDIAVHIVLVGMSQMSYAMAVTAAHACHFPNFMSKGIRTRISFIDSNMKEEMNFFRGKYAGVMDLSYCRYINMENPALNKEYYPDVQYQSGKDDKKGFLDVEWEFIDGSIADEDVRAYITECVERDGREEYLTLAFCHGSPEVNMAACQYLPRVVYDKNIPLFIYQPGEDQLAKSLRKTDMYKNVYPFGSKSNSYDRQFYKRLMVAMRINYIYHLTNLGEEFSAFPAKEEMKALWFENKYAFQLSNIYAANSIPFKLRSIGHQEGDAITKEQIELLAELEHNRWNVERLLIGFRAYPLKERRRFSAILSDKTSPDHKAVKEEIKQRKALRLLHKDIAPYSELDEGTKNYDKAIARHLMKVIEL